MDNIEIQKKQTGGRVSITINIDDTSKLKGLINDEVDKLKPEDIKDIVTEVIKQYLTCINYANLEPLIIESKKKYDWDITKTKSASEFTNKLIESLDYSKMQEVADACIEDLRENHRDIILELLERQFFNKLFDNDKFRNNLESTIHKIFYQIERNRINNNL